MYHPCGQSTYPQNGPYQPSQSHNMPRPFQQQQFGPRFQTPSQQLTTPGLFYQSPRQPQQRYDHQRPPYISPIQRQPFYQPPIPNFETPPNSQYLPPPANSSGFNQTSLHSSRTSVSTYKPHIQNLSVHNYNQPIQNYNQPPPVQNYNQPPPVQNFNQPPPAPVQNFNQPPPAPVQNFNQPPPAPIQNYNQPPPVQSYNPSVTPYQPANQSCHQPMHLPFQSSSPRYGSMPNVPYQPQVQSPESVKQSYQLPTDQCYQQQQSSYDSRYGFNQRSPFNTPGNQRFPFKTQNPRYQQSQHDNNRLKYNPKQQYQNFQPRGPLPNFSNQPKCNNILKNDKPKITCNMDNCDFVGHASAVKEHQNMHHRFGLHKKVLYSNNSEAVKNWIQERKKKWPTKETIQIKSKVEDEKNKRGERIADEDFQRFNKKKQFNHSGSKQFNNRKRPGFNGEFIKPVEELMNGNLKRFPGIVDMQEEYHENIDETRKPIALKLLEEYKESSDDEPPEETAIVKKSESFNNKSLIETNEESCSTFKMEIISTEHNEEVNISLVDNVSEAINTKVNNESSSKVNKCEKTDSEPRGQKRKKNSKKETKPLKKIPPLRTPRTEVIERKAALLEALMGDLMRKERNTITQCICYIRKNMHRFCKTQAA